VELLSGVKVTGVACGFDHTLALTQNGELLSFGDNSLGQLGRPARAEGEHAPPADAAACQVHAAWPDGEEHRAGAPRFRLVAAGLGHNLGMASEGTVMSWGWNAAGQLGLGEAHAGEQVVPNPTAVYGIPKNNKGVVAAGRVHSVLATDDIRHDRASSPAAYGRAWPCLTMCHT
jgi:alpha-tubulin suppressor-like RCC1 family protein